jgi:predicted DNA-binding transcriptional regulator AlpA
MKINNKNNKNEAVAVMKKDTSFLSTREISKRWGLSRNAIFRLVQEGKIRPIVGVGKGFLWTGDELEGLVLARL